MRLPPLPIVTRWEEEAVAVVAGVAVAGEAEAGWTAAPAKIV